MKFICETCDRSFTRKSSLKRHLRTHQKLVESVFCSECHKSFANSSNLKQHFENKHKDKKMNSKIDVGKAINKGFKIAAMASVATQTNELCACFADIVTNEEFEPVKTTSEIATQTNDDGFTGTTTNNWKKMLLLRHSSASDSQRKL